MAWIVYDALPGQDAIGRTPAIYGPLPCKRWVPVKGEKYKVRKSAAPRGSGADWRTADERRAREYARWLAARDGIELPDGAATIVWGGVTTRAGKWSKRIRAVSFGGSGAWHVSIMLPHWDFDPAPPVESVVNAETVFADLLPRGLSLLADALADVDSREPVRELEAA